MGTYGNIQHGFEKPTLIQQKTPGIEIVVSSPSKQPGHIKKTHNSRGIPTSNSQDPIRSYDDYLLLKEYFSKQRHGLRNHMLFILGSTTGLRVSDLTLLKYSDIFEEDNITFRQSINTLEEKTNKNTVTRDDEVLITEAARKAISDYLDSRFWQFNRNDWLFWSQKPVASGLLKGEHVLTEQQCWRIMDDFQKKYKLTNQYNLPLNLGSHTFRNTFTAVLIQIVANTDDEKIRRLMNGIGVAQIALRHSDIKTTMRYAKHTKGLMFAVRNKISDFFLDKTNFKKLSIDYDEIFDDV